MPLGASDAQPTTSSSEPASRDIVQSLDTITSSLPALGTRKPTPGIVASSPTFASASPLASPTSIQQPTPTVRPTPTIPSEVTLEVEEAILPPGFSMIKFADLTWPTSLAFDNEGRLYAASNDGTIHVLLDEDNDGRSDQDVIVASDFRLPLGIAIHPENGDIYVSSLGRITILRNNEGDLRADESMPFVTRLPYDWHQNNNLKFGPDGLLYLGIGSTCNACEDEDPRSATIMRFDLESAEGEIYASGLRNAYDIAFHPTTGDLFATDNGRDDLGEKLPDEELNHIIQGGDYGYPNCWDEATQPGCNGTLTAIAYFEPHSSANSLAFQVSDLLPDAYTSDDNHAVAYVAIYGAWHAPEVVTGITRVQLTATGDTYEGQVDWFAKWPGNPLGLAISSDGDLFVGDYKNHAIYRISYGS